MAHFLSFFPPFWEPGCRYSVHVCVCFSGWMAKPQDSSVKAASICLPLSPSQIPPGYNTLLIHVAPSYKIYFIFWLTSFRFSLFSFSRFPFSQVFTLKIWFFIYYYRKTTVLVGSPQQCLKHTRRALLRSRIFGCSYPWNSSKRQLFSCVFVARVMVEFAKQLPTGLMQIITISFCQVSIDYFVVSYLLKIAFLSNRKWLLYH